MFFKRDRVEVVAPMDDEEFEKVRNDHKYVTRKEVAIATAIPTTAAIGYVTYQAFNKPETQTIVNEPVNVLSAPSQPQTIPSTLSDGYTALQVNTTPMSKGEWGLSNSNSGLEGFSNGMDALADFSIDLFAVFAEPILKFLMVLSFPVASIITVCSFFMIMFGMKEKAFSMLISCGVGYTLIQCSPLLLELYKIIGQNLS